MSGPRRANRYRTELERARAHIVEIEAERDRLLTDVEASARHANALSERMRAAETEVTRLKAERGHFLAKLTDWHDVPPEHESEPVAFHKGWELAVRGIRAALSGEGVT
jgi:chromosome segregation ATPase